MQAATHHLRRFREAGLVESRRGSALELTLTDAGRTALKAASA